MKGFQDSSGLPDSPEFIRQMTDPLAAPARDRHAFRRHCAKLIATLPARGCTGVSHQGANFIGLTGTRF